MIKLLTGAIILFFLLSSFMVNAKSKVIAPKSYKKKMHLMISGKKRVYYEIQNKKYSLLTLKGPGKLRIITRAGIKSNSNTGAEYVLYYKVDGGNIERVKFDDVTKSKKAVYKKDDNFTPGKAQDFYIELDRGEHVIEIKNGTGMYSVSARYLFYSTKPKKIDWISINPVASIEPVDLVTREDITHYYRFSKEEPLVIEIIGPTQLRILTRFENNYKMKGDINYRLNIKMNGTNINSYLLSSKRSEVTSYLDNKNLLPGKAKEIYIKVPEGKHRIRIISLDDDKKTILGRILFPKKDTSNKIS
ncbi:hypothetical protein BMS3Abin03_02659 [bacterium BMS3Abin03]|nr:hypothetical protein BMS3Abin03_02659 [bacterium BMS3Abin03]